MGERGKKPTPDLHKGASHKARERWGSDKGVAEMQQAKRTDDGERICQCRSCVRESPYVLTTYATAVQPEREGNVMGCACVCLCVCRRDRDNAHCSLKYVQPISCCGSRRSPFGRLCIRARPSVVRASHDNPAGREQGCH
jgi:hypothetical protein